MPSLSQAIAKSLCGQSITEKIDHKLLVIRCSIRCPSWRWPSSPCVSIRWKWKTGAWWWSGSPAGTAWRRWK